jgi:long-chain acyl-CoA synthetase
MVSERLSEGPISLDGTSPSREWWVFDVDGCLVDSLTGTSLRPGARELLGHLNKRSAGALLWSAGGAAYAMERARQFSIDEFVTGYYGKDSRDGDGFYRIDHLPAGCRDAVFVDDRPEDLSKRLDVLAVSPYLSDDSHDRGLHAAARRAGVRTVLQR